MKKTIKLMSVAFVAMALLFSCKCDKSDKLSINYDEYTLDNGLKVVLHQDSSDPIVAVAIQFHVGSGREKPGKTGFAHFFEHMLFQRSENLPRNAFFQKIANMGGEFNGGTGQDGTVYYEQVPRDALEKVLWMESDRMGFFINTVTQAGLDREIDVILNEKRQTSDNQAYGQEFAIYSKAMYPQGHPYSWTVIGDMDDIRSATIEDVKEFYSTYYVPSNATLVIAGDFDPAQTKELIQKYFGEIKTREIEKPQVWNVTLDQTKKLYYEDMFAPLPYLSISFPTVEEYNKDEAALNLLGRLLSGSKKSPLYKTIVEANLSSSANAGNGSNEVAGAFDISVRAFSGISLDTVYAAIQKAFAMFEESGVDEEELAMFKAMQERSVYNRTSSVLGKAMTLANGAEYGGKPDIFIDNLEALKAVTAEDIMRVYNQYIKGKNFVAISMVPKGQVALVLSESIPAKVKVENVEDASSQKVNSKAGAIVDDDYPRTESAFDRSIEPDYLPNAPVINIPAIWNTTLANGITVSGISHNEIPLVTFDLTIKGGMLLDPADKLGLAYLNAAMMNEGTALRTAEDLEHDLNMLGASVRVSASRESMTINGSCLARNFAAVIDIVEEIITKPAYDQSVLDREKNKAVARIQQDKQNPNNIAATATAKLMFGKESIMYKPSYGTLETLPNITLDDVKAFAKNVTPKAAHISIAGAINQAECEKAFAKLAADWTGEDVVVPEINMNIEAKEGEVYFVDYSGSKQSVIYVAGPGKPFSDNDHFKLDVLNYKLGSGSNGMLFDILRLQRGYTYGAYSGFNPDKNYGMFFAYSSVQSTVTKESLDIFNDIFTNYGAEFTEEKLAQTKDALIRSKVSQFETQGNLVYLLRDMYEYDLPANYVTIEEETIKGTTLDDVKALAEEYLQKGLVYVVVGDAKTQFKNVKGAVKFE